MWTRWVLQRLYVAIATGKPVRAALGAFNDVLGDALRRMQLEQTGTPGRRQASIAGGIVRSWQGMGEVLESPLWPLVWHACALLTSPDLSQLRVCAGENCGWMYTDRSRNGLRRWCRMETCGTREKNRRRALTAGD